MASIVLAIVLSYSLCFRPDPDGNYPTGIWLRRDSYREQPIVHFNYKAIIIAQVTDIESNEGKTLYFSSINHLNRQSNNFRPATITSRDQDFNLDGLVDRIHIDFRLPLQNELVESVQMIGFFQYELKMHVKMEMESMLYFDYQGSFPGSGLEISGDLLLRQNEPLRVDHTSVHLYKEESIFHINHTAPLMSEQETIRRILDKFNDRGVGTDFNRRFSSWKLLPMEEPTELFTLEVDVDIPKLQSIVFIPTPYEAFLESWMRYLSIFVIVGSLIRVLSRHLFEYQILQTKVKQIKQQ